MDEVEKVMAKAAGLQQVRDLIAIEECVLAVMKKNDHTEAHWLSQFGRLVALREVAETLERGLALETP